MKWYHWILIGIAVIVAVFFFHGQSNGTVSVSVDSGGNPASPNTSSPSGGGFLDSIVAGINKVIGGITGIITGNAGGPAPAPAGVPAPPLINPGLIPGGAGGPVTHPVSPAPPRPGGVPINPVSHPASTVGGVGTGHASPTYYPNQGVTLRRYTP